MIRWLPLLALTLVPCGCGGAPSEPSTPGAEANPDQGPTHKYLPLEAGTVMAYDTVDEDTGERGMVVLRVSRPREGLVELSDGGRVQRLEVTETSVRHAVGGFLLKAPLTRGATFRGRFGQVTVARTDVSATVPAGKFQGCLETVEENNTKTKRATTLFCPHVGMVSLSVEGTIRGEFGKVTFVLRSHGAAVDIDAAPPAPDPAGD